MTYFLLIEIAIIVLIIVIFRHSYFRARLFLQMFQQKGYKLNEYRAWFKSRFSDSIISPPHLFIIPLFLIEISRNVITDTAAAIAVCIFGLFSFSWTSYMRPKNEKKPLVITPRVKRLLVILGLLYAGLLWFALSAGYQSVTFLPEVIIIALLLVVYDMFMPMLVMLAGWLTKPVENMIQEGFKNKARNKLAAMKELKVIAITGSYGKTSTKFVLKTLLSERFNVCYTPGSFNTPMGICKVINNDLQPNHQILILEMGARYKGNITELCNIARPHVSVITNVGKAHLETFGSVDAIAETKGELLLGLHANGTAVINSDDPLVTSMPRRTDTMVIPAGLKTGTIKASDISYDKNGCSFSVIQEGKAPVKVVTPLLGEHNVQNILLGFAVGNHFGLRIETMALAASKLEPVEHRLELKKGHDYTIIDDAFNSNPIGARNAVDVLCRFNEGRRFIVTPGMIELGEEEFEENKTWGMYIGERDVDFVLLIGENQTKPIYEGLLLAGYPESNILIFATFFDARKWLEENRQAGDVILYENDLPDSYNE